MITPIHYLIYIAILFLVGYRQIVKLEKKERAQRRWERKIAARKKLWNK